MGLEAVERLSQLQAVNEEISIFDADDEFIKFLRIELHASHWWREIEDAVLLVVLLYWENFACVIITARCQKFFAEIDAVNISIVSLDCLQACRFGFVGRKHFDLIIGRSGEKNISNNESWAKF